ncbi:DUF4083 family protein [Desulfuribacillus alkaliarsenatis]|uniref:DUF4083 family protein n=1 Tax=Desulfuribacillus alkaliarsenatis TaxID=766136 RepID=UPI000A03E633|nr:DUF4083 family protein [Desulfuribacillus alkaliarsenatis]
MAFQLGTAIVQLISLFILGLIVYSIFLVVRYFQKASSKLENIEEKIDRIENQINK